MANTVYDKLFKDLLYKPEKEQTEKGYFEIEKEFYFRGHSDSSYLLTPAIFRESKLTETEVYHEIFRNHADEFRGMKPIDVLTKMQHYGVPTRLLDITSNPLVASFFSVSNLSKDELPKEKSPEVLAFEVEKEKIKNFDSDTVKLLSHLPLLKQEERKKLRIDALNSILIYATIRYIENYLDEKEYHIVQEKKQNDKDVSFPEELIRFVKNYQPTDENCIEGECPPFKIEGKIKNIGNLYISSSKVEMKVKELINNEHSASTVSSDSKFEIEIDNSKIEEKSPITLSFNKNNKVLNVAIEKTNPPKISDFIEEHYSYEDSDSIKIDVMRELYFQIKQNYPVFYDCARPLDLLNGVFVTPIVSSDRMKAQQGAFMLFGLSRYWDIIKCMKYLENKGLGYEEIINFIVEDKPLDDKDNQLTLHLKNDNKTDEDINKAIKEFEDAVFEVKRYKLKNTAESNVIKKLDVMGINKQTLGCGMDTTYYNLLSQKE